MTGLLGRELVDAVSIAAVTTATLAAGHREERSGIVLQRRGWSRIALTAGLAAVALAAAVAVVAIFRPQHGASAAVSPAATLEAQPTAPVLQAAGRYAFQWTAAGCRAVPLLLSPPSGGRPLRHPPFVPSLSGGRSRCRRSAEARRR